MDELDELEAQVNAMLADGKERPEYGTISLRLSLLIVGALRRDRENFELRKQALVESLRVTHELGLWLKNRKDDGHGEETDGVASADQ